MSVFCYLDPCVLAGDFDGDRKDDQVAPVESKRTRKRGFAFLHGNGRDWLVGLGQPVPGGRRRDDDFTWVLEWQSSPKEQWKLVDGAPSEIEPKGHFIFANGEESSSGMLLYWDGRRYAAIPVDD